jgi:hypothetical protein
MRPLVETDRYVQPALGAPLLHHAQRLRERLAMAARHAGMNNPTVPRVLDEERAEWDEQLGERERIPTPADLDLDCGRDAALSDSGWC